MTTAPRYTVKGRGTYGCVLSPAVPCAGEVVDPHFDPHKHVSKIFQRHPELHQNFIPDSEFETQARVRDADKRQLYTVTAKRVCDATVTPDMVKNCSKETDAMSEDKWWVDNIRGEETLRQVIYEDGGATLIELAARETTTLPDLLRGFLHLARGLHDLHSKDVFLLDIKPANVVGHSPSKLRFIDFFETRHFNSLTREKMQAYLPWPMDINVGVLVNLASEQVPQLHRDASIDDLLRVVAEDKEDAYVRIKTKFNAPLRLLTRYSPDFFLHESIFNRLYPQEFVQRQLRRQLRDAILRQTINTRRFCLTKSPWTCTAWASPLHTQ